MEADSTLPFASETGSMDGIFKGSKAWERYQKFVVNGKCT